MDNDTRSKTTHLPDSELEIMQIIWQEKPPVSRMTIEDRLSKTHRLASTTVLTLLTRLCDRGFLSVKKEKRTNMDTPQVSEKDYLASESRNLFTRLYRSSTRTFAAALCDSGISREDLDELREMLEKGAL